jgi:hypothetical protein
LRNIVSGRRFAAYAEARRAAKREDRAISCAVPFGETAVIAIRTQADTVRACAAAEDMASVLSFSSFEQAFLTAGAASLARMILNWPAQGEIAVAIVGRAGLRGLAIVARFKGYDGPEFIRRNPVSRLRRHIEEMGPGWDGFDESEPDGVAVATLVKWSRPEQSYEEPDVS